MTTTASGFFYPATSYTSGIFQAMKDAADAAEAVVGGTRQIKTYQWADSTERAAESGMVEGDLGYQADTNLYYRYSGSAWGNLANSLSGLVPIVPTSVTATGGTLGANGVVGFAAAASVTVAGCFSATYDNYAVILELTATTGVAGQVYAQLKAGAGATVTTNYSGSAYEVTTGGVGGGISGPTSAFIIGRVGAATGYARGKVDIYSPFLAVPTLVQGSGVDNSGIVRASQGGLNTNSTSYDSLVITLSTAGNMTGRAWFYGYNNN
jgi:hypothetical protein